MVKTLRLIASHTGKTGENEVMSAFGSILENEDQCLAIDYVKSDSDTFTAILSEQVEYDVVEMIATSQSDPNFVIIEEVEVDIEDMFVHDSKHLYPDQLSYQHRQDDEVSDIKVSQQNHEADTYMNDYSEEDDNDYLSDEDELEELIPSAEIIMRELNPVITDVPVATSQWSIIAANQQHSMISMLYASMARDFGSVKKSVLDEELLKFKNSVKSNLIYEVSKYLNSKKHLVNYRNEINNQIETIRASYDLEFKRWIDEKLDELKSQYMTEHPDTTEEQVQQLLLQIKPEMDKAELEVESNKLFAEQAMIREFSNFSKHPELSSALTFIIAKEQAREALKSSIPTLNGSHQVAIDNMQTVENQEDDQVTNHFVYEDDEETTPQTTYQDEPENQEDQRFVYENEEIEELNSISEEQESLTDILSRMTDEEIKRVYDLISEGVDSQELITRYKNGQLFDDFTSENYQETSLDGLIQDDFHTQQSLEPLEPLEALEDLDVTEQLEIQRNEQEMALPQTSNFEEEPMFGEIPTFMTEEVEQPTQQFEPLPDTDLTMFDEELDLGNTGTIPDLSNFVDEQQYLGKNSDVLNNVENKELNEFNDGLNKRDNNIDFDVSAEELEFGKDSDDFDEGDFVMDDEDSPKPKKSKKNKPSTSSQMKKFAIAGSAIAALSTIGVGGYLLTQNGDSKDAKPTTHQTTKENNNEAVLKFFERAEKVGIDVDQAFTFTDEKDGEISGTISSLRSDGSITVTLDNGEQKIVPFSVVKSKVVALESNANQEQNSENKSE